MNSPACLSTCECKPYVRQLEHTIHSLREQLKAQQHLVYTLQAQARAPRQRASAQSQITQNTHTPAVQSEHICTPRTPPRSPSCSPIKKRKLRWHEHAVPGLIEFQLDHCPHPRIQALMALPWSQGQSCVGALRASLASGSGVAELVELSRRSDGHNNADNLRALSQFAHRSIRRTASAETELAYGRFQQFLLVLACAVLEMGGTNLDALSSIISIGLGELYSGAWCKTLMSTALWLSKLVKALDDEGWDMRASELLLAWNQKICFFRPLALSPHDNIQALVNELRPHRDEFLRTPSFMTLSVPVLLSMILPESGLDTICMVIGIDANVIGTAPWAQSRSQ